MKEENIVNTDGNRHKELESMKISSSEEKAMKESEVEAVANSLSLMRIKREPTEDDEEKNEEENNSNDSKRSSSNSERGDNSNRSSSNSDKGNDSNRRSSNSESNEICSQNPVVDSEMFLCRGPMGGTPVQDNVYAFKAYNGLSNPDYNVQKFNKRQVEEPQDTDPYFKYRRPFENNQVLQQDSNFDLHNSAMNKILESGSTFSAHQRDMMGGGKLVVKSSSLDMSQDNFIGTEDVVDTLINGGNPAFQMPDISMGSGTDQQRYNAQNLQSSYVGQQYFHSQNVNSMSVSPCSYNSPNSYSSPQEGMIQTNMNRMAYPCIPSTAESNRINMSNGMIDQLGCGTVNSGSSFNKMQRKQNEPVESETEGEKSPFSDQMYSPESSKSINSPPPSNMSGDSGIVGDAVGSPLSNMSPPHEMGGQYTWDEGNRSPATKSMQSPQMMNVPSPQQVNSSPQLRSVPSPQQKLTPPSPIQVMTDPSSRQRLGPSNQDSYQDIYVEQNLGTLQEVLEVIGEDLLEQNQSKKNENLTNYSQAPYTKMSQAPPKAPPQGQQNSQFIGQGQSPRQSNIQLMGQSQFPLPPKQIILPAANSQGQASNQNIKQPQGIPSNIPMTMLSKPPNQTKPIQSFNAPVPSSFVSGPVTVQQSQISSQPLMIMTQPNTMVTSAPPIAIQTQTPSKSVPVIMVPPPSIAPQPVVTGQGQPNTIIIVQTNQQLPAAKAAPKKQRAILPKVPQSNTDTKSSTNAVNKTTPAPRAGPTGNINEKRPGMSLNKQMGNQTASPQAQQRLYQLNLARRTVADISREHLMYEDDEGDTYLHVAVCRTDSSMVQALLERLRREQLEYRIDVQNKQTQTPLYLAVAANQPQMVNMFLRCKANPNTMAQVKSADGSIEVKAPIHVASSNGEEYLSTLQELLKMPNVDLNMRNSEGCSALHCAILAHRRQNQKGQIINSIPVIEMLIKKGAEPNSQDLKSGKTPLMYAIEKRDPNLVEKLLCLFDATKLKNIVKNSQTFDGSSCLKIAEGLKTDYQQDTWQRLWNMLNAAINGDPPRIQYCK